MYQDLLDEQEPNPTPTNIMVISDTDAHEAFSTAVAHLVQIQKHNLFLAYSSRPYQILVLLPSAEWLWHSLLEGVIRFFVLSSHHPLVLFDN